MTAATALIPGLDDIVRHGDPKRRGDVALRIAQLFLQDPARFGTDSIELFDGILTGLLPSAEVQSKIDLAERFATLSNAPRGLIGQLARENEVAIASPVLRLSPVLDEDTLVDIARVKGQGHLLAMAERSILSSAITDVLVARGDREVVRCAAGNGGAQFSPLGYSEMIKRARQDGVLTLRIGQREDLSGEQLKELLDGSIDVVRRRLHKLAKPSRQAQIEGVIGQVDTATSVPGSRRKYAQARRTVDQLLRDGHLTESALLGFAKAGKYEEAVVALSAISGLTLATLDRLMSAERYDPLLIIGRAADLSWATVRSLIVLKLGIHQMPSAAELELARANFTQLMPSTVERVVGFWKTR